MCSVFNKLHDIGVSANPCQAHRVQCLTRHHKTFSFMMSFPAMSIERLGQGEMGVRLYPNSKSENSVAMAWLSCSGCDNEEVHATTASQPWLMDSLPMQLLFSTGRL